MSRFDETLASAVAEERNEGRRLQLKLKIAASRARRGNISSARQIISAVRSEVGRSESAQLFAHINFAEGICDYFEGGARSALDKLKRAKALAIACPIDDDLPCLISAWLAGAYRILGDWNQLFDCLQQVFLIDRALSDETSARVSLVLADSLHETENQLEADKWYQISRKLAIRYGDESTIGAILYNRSVVRVFNLRIAEANEEEINIDECRVSLEAASAENYSLYVHDESMRWAFGILSGQLHLLKGSFAKALEQLSTESIMNLESAWPAVDVVRVADVLRCKAGLGEIDSAELISRSVALSSRPSDYVGSGDLAVAFHSLRVACQQLGDSYAAECQSETLRFLEKFRLEQKTEADVIRRFFDSMSNTPKFVDLSSVD